MLTFRKLFVLTIGAAVALGTPLNHSPSANGKQEGNLHFKDAGAFTASPTVKVREEPTKTQLAKRQTTWNPPSELVTGLNEVWAHTTATYDMNFKNFGYDQLIAANGTAKVCVRWETTSGRTISAAERTKVQTAIQRSYKKWVDGWVGFMNFPYTSVPLTVVGYAVKNTSYLTGSTSGIDVYTTVDGDGVPECDPRCGRVYHQDNNYSGCPGGASHHYDFSVWLTEGMDGSGYGGDWGMQVGLNYFMTNLDTENIHILLHEMGHYFALDDFYDWVPTGVTNFIMRAGSAFEVTPFDMWMSRDWWRHIKSRYGL